MYRSALYFYFSRNYLCLYPHRSWIWLTFPHFIIIVDSSHVSTICSLAVLFCCIFLSITCFSARNLSPIESSSTPTNIYFFYDTVDHVKVFPHYYSQPASNIYWYRFNYLCFDPSANTSRKVHNTNSLALPHCYYRIYTQRIN